LLDLPSRGEVWQVNLSPTEGHEQHGLRPFLVLSIDAMNHGPSGLVIGVPLTTTYRKIPGRVTIRPPEGGLTQESYALCDQVRTISTARLVRRMGRVQDKYVAQVLTYVKFLLGLHDE
jgi:mRNA interferase MazF